MKKALKNIFFTSIALSILIGINCANASQENQFKTWGWFTDNIIYIGSKPTDKNNFTLLQYMNNSGDSMFMIREIFLGGIPNNDCDNFTEKSPKAVKITINSKKFDFYGVCMNTGNTAPTWAYYATSKDTDNYILSLLMNKKSVSLNTPYFMVSLPSNGFKKVYEELENKATLKKQDSKPTVLSCKINKGDGGYWDSIFKVNYSNNTVNNTSANITEDYIYFSTNKLNVKINRYTANITVTVPDNNVSFNGSCITVSNQQF